MNIPLKDKIIINLALAGLCLAIALLYVVVKLKEFLQWQLKYAHNVKRYKERVRPTTHVRRF